MPPASSVVVTAADERLVERLKRELRCCEAAKFERNKFLEANTLFYIFDVKTPMKRIAKIKRFILKLSKTPIIFVASSPSL
jgi:hypothetical protein